MKYIAAFLIMTLVACTAKSEPELIVPVVIQREAIDRPTLSLPPVDRLTSQNVNWTIVTPDNVEQVFVDMQSRGAAPVLFSVSATGYENIAINTQEALRVIVQQQAVIDGYQVYYIRADGTIAEYNSSQ
jgi:hypothetical protein